VIVVAPKGNTLATLVDLLEKLRDKSAECLVVSNDNHALSFGLKSMRMPDMPEWISPVAGVIPGQIFAMNLAGVKGYNVDQPRGLTKVTVTR
jgi:glucosamine--fructose-6-phosphate aminotransferase (isomerizing)